MDTSHENDILRDHPLIFRELEPRWPSGERFECGLGWKALLADLATALEYIARRGEGNPPRVTQVKEKLGGLRVYFAGPQSDEVNALVAAAERRSKSVCEVCGQPGGLVWRSRYLRSRCDACNAEECGPQR